MKNKIKKNTVNSLFNSIQFNSIPKIIFLIALLFLVSCSSNEDPIEGNKERTLSYYAGTWGWNNAGIYFIINSDGSITHKVNGIYWG